MADMKTVGERLQEVGLNDQQAKEALKVFLQYLPSPVDIPSKWEVNEGGIHVVFNGRKSHDDAMLMHVAKFSEDQGYNKYYHELHLRLAGNPTPIDKSFFVGEDRDTNT